MELKQNSLELKNKLISSVRQWADQRIDAFFAENKQFKPVSLYMKRAVNNLLVREDMKIEGWVDNVMLFIADENGEYSAETLFDDAMTIFKEMEEKPFNTGIINGSIGKGQIRIELPNNPIRSFLFGDMKAIRITDADFEELRAIITDNYK